MAGVVLDYLLGTSKTVANNTAKVRGKKCYMGEIHS